MQLDPKAIELAIFRYGLNSGDPVHIDDHRQALVSAGRMAEFLTRQGFFDGLDPKDFSELSTKAPGRERL